MAIGKVLYSAENSLAFFIELLSNNKFLSLESTQSQAYRSNLVRHEFWIFIGFLVSDFFGLWLVVVVGYKRFVNPQTALESVFLFSTVMKFPTLKWLQHPLPKHTWSSPHLQLLIIPCYFINLVTTLFIRKGYRFLQSGSLLSKISYISCSIYKEITASWKYDYQSLDFIGKYVSSIKFIYRDREENRH